ncbi:MAG: hypothetical protein BroJett011_04170 [Chloroflexota bacterium]|nr:MAG: hypothetical protein BroJett011_04170 [Chloroflexota bacterium]
MLNLSQLNHSVNTASVALVPNPNHLLGQSLAYRQLKEAGWQCIHNELHPTERVPLFRLGDASIRRNKSGQSHWLVEVGGETYITSAPVAEITAAVKGRLAELAEAEAEEPLPIPASSPALVAAWLKDEYPALAGRIDRALELVELGTLDLDKYGTAWDNAGYYGTWSCDCPDAVNRGESLRTRWGAGCKHALAGLIVQLVEGERKQVAYRKLADKIERDRARLARTQAGYEAALRPGGGGPLNRPRYQFGGPYGR